MRKHVKGMRGGRRGETRKKRGVVELHVAEKCPAHLPSQCSLWWPTPFVPLCSVCLWERYREQLSKSVGDVDKAFMILHCVSTAVGTHTNTIRLLYTHAQGSLHNKNNWAAPFVSKHSWRTTAFNRTKSYQYSVSCESPKDNRWGRRSEQHVLFFILNTED